MQAIRFKAANSNCIGQRKMYTNHVTWVSVNIYHLSSHFGCHVVTSVSGGLHLDLMGTQIKMSCCGNEGLRSCMEAHIACAR